MFFFEKKNKKNKKKYFNNFFYYFGIFSFFFILILFLLIIPNIRQAIDKYYFNVNIDQFNLNNSRISKIVEKTLGPSYFSLDTPGKLIDYIRLIVVENLNKQKIDRIELNINFENLQILENQRTNREYNIKWAKAKSVFITEDKRKKINFKLRAKGDREIHRINLKQMSFKMDVLGNDRVYGLEEFSLQKPIVRNYSLEIIASKIMKINNILSPKTKLINLYINGEDLGIYHLEEGFSKEIIELNKRKNGPIFGIEETIEGNFPNVVFDIYSEENWNKENPDLLNVAKSKLEYIKNNYNKKDFNLFLYFDVDLWSKYFALNDILASHHGTINKSVKLYYNPTIERFEPIFFDGHINIGSSKTNVILSDFISTIINDYKKQNLGYLYQDKNWFKLFFNKSKYNQKFLKLYLDHLSFYTGETFQKEFNKIIDEAEIYNRIYYSRFMPSDGIFSKSILPFYFDKSFFLKRRNFIKKKLPELETILSNIDTEPIDKNYLLKKDNEIFVKDIVVLDKNKYFLDNINFQKKSILFKNPSILFLSGNNYISDSKISGPVMIVQKSGLLKINNSNFDGLSNIKINSTNWTGSMNVINTVSSFKNVNFENINAEDAVNFVNSSGTLENIKILNSTSDAIDIDFGKFNFNGLHCENIKNDCLDVSNSVINGYYLYAHFVQDKVLSSGENSIVNINHVVSENSEIGIVSKDSSRVIVNDIIFKNTKLHGAVFKKKKMFEGQTYLKIISKNKLKDTSYKNKFLVSKESFLEINDFKVKSKYTSEEIESMMYGNIYGKKTIR